jgi:hypothetical protein
MGWASVMEGYKSELEQVVVTRKVRQEYTRFTRSHFLIIQLPAG